MEPGGSKKVVGAIIVAVLVGVIIYLGTAERGNAPAAKPGNENGVSTLKTYRNEEEGIEFQYPAQFEEKAAATEDNAVYFAYENGTYKGKVDYEGCTPADPLEETLSRDTILGPSGKHPALADFKKSKLNDRDVYSIRAERFEGTLQFVYYVVVPDAAALPCVYRFESVAQGVDWTNPALDEENDPAHAALKEMLATLKLAR